MSRVRPSKKVLAVYRLTGDLRGVLRPGMVVRWKATMGNPRWAQHDAVLGVVQRCARGKLRYIVGVRDMYRVKWIGDGGRLSVWQSFSVPGNISPVEP